MRVEHRRPLVASIIVAMVCAVLVGHGFREKAVQQLIEHGVPVMVLAPLAPDVIVSAEQGARARKLQQLRASAMATLALAGTSVPEQTAPVQTAHVGTATTAPVEQVAPSAPRPAAAPHRPAAHQATRHHPTAHQATRHHPTAHHATRHHAARHRPARSHHQPPVQARTQHQVAAPHHSAAHRHAHGHQHGHHRGH